VATESFFDDLEEMDRRIRQNALARERGESEPYPQVVPEWMEWPGVPGHRSQTWKPLPTDINLEEIFRTPEFPSRERVLELWEPWRQVEDHFPNRPPEQTGGY
jgi:hypothetical protein